MYPDQAISPDVLLLDATDSEKKAAHSGTMTPSPWRDTKYAAGKTTFQFHDRREESSVAQMSMDKQMVTFLGTVAKYLTRSNFKEERSILMYRLRGCGPSCWGRHDRRNSSPAGLHCRYAWVWCQLHFACTQAAVLLVFTLSPVPVGWFLAAQSDASSS
ncbi:uncharacterized protein LOC143443762 isoform X3 [Arvicanthis niloticus]|uniref:uncharacterized protein LOC143314038 isoform X3 n=1 Tax=Arvicanthis niloticus TaxID=61156 RepID=UPI00402B7F8D